MFSGFGVRVCCFFFPSAHFHGTLSVIEMLATLRYNLPPSSTAPQVFEMLFLELWNTAFDSCWGPYAGYCSRLLH
jgi:hypothetical protein